jgi:hypothetical protein
MGVLFEDAFLDGFGTWPLAYTTYGGPDFGELFAVAQTVAQTLFDALKCKKKLVRFTAAEGAGGHCEMMNRSAVNRVALDWLDKVFDLSLLQTEACPLNP